MMSTRKHIRGLLLESERKKFRYLILLSFVAAIIDAAGIASVMPFIALMTDAQSVVNNRFISQAYEFMNIDSDSQFILAFGWVLFCVFIFSVLFRAFVHYLTINFIFHREHSISSRLFKNYISNDLQWHFDKVSGVLTKNVLSEVNVCVRNFLLPLSILFAQGASIVCLGGLLLVVDPVITLVCFCIFAMVYLVILRIFDPVLTKNSVLRERANADRFVSVSEALSSILLVQQFGLRKFFTSRFWSSSLSYAQTQVIAQLIGHSPRYVLELTGFGCMLLSLLWLKSGYSEFQNALPSIALFGLVAFRMLPSFQQCYNALTQIRFAESSLKLISGENAPRQGSTRSEVCFGELGQLAPWEFRSMAIRDVSLVYPDGRVGLEGINLTVRRGDHICLVGSTGSGKTSIARVLCGLLPIQTGLLEVNGEPSGARLPSVLRRAIQYIPQDLTIISGTVAENICLSNSSPDMDRLRRACSDAEILNFIETNLEYGFSHMLDDRALNISGGQRQRICWARAFYRGGDVFVLDEATSALDGETEKRLISNLKRRQPDVTIINVTHRLDSFDDVDRIVKVSQGRIVSQNRGIDK